MPARILDQSSFLNIFSVICLQKKAYAFGKLLKCSFSSPHTGFKTRSFQRRAPGDMFRSILDRQDQAHYHLSLTLWYLIMLDNCTHARGQTRNWAKCVLRSIAVSWWLAVVFKPWRYIFKVKSANISDCISIYKHVVKRDHTQTQSTLNFFLCQLLLCLDFETFFGLLIGNLINT